MARQLPSILRVARPLVCLLGVSAPLHETQAAASAIPNVLFIAVDDMNNWIGCLGATD